MGPRHKKCHEPTSRNLVHYLKNFLMAFLIHLTLAHACCSHMQTVLKPSETSDRGTPNFRWRAPMKNVECGSFGSYSGPFNRDIHKWVIHTNNSNDHFSFSSSQMNVRICGVAKCISTGRNLILHGTQLEG
jgi:hypothetical protein